MKILIRQFLGKNHSWSVCGWGIATALKKLGHEVHLFSTDGIKYLPQDLKENLIGYVEENQPIVYGKLPDAEYDAQFSYTCMTNFPRYLSNGNTNRFGIWVYEWGGHNALPTGFAKYYNKCDYLCPPSNFGKRVFIDSGVPETAIKVISHGINTDQYNNTKTIELPTTKRFKILVNVAQNHLRKNIPGLLEAYGKAFSAKDDVCLIFKGKDRPIKQQFEVSLSECIKDFNRKFPNHAEFKLFNEFVDDMSNLYRSVDATFSLSHCEGFLFPALESIAAGKIVIASGHGGQLDFLNNSNALLVDGKEVRTNPKSMYWESKNNALWFNPSIDDAVDKLRYAYDNYAQLNNKVKSQQHSILDKYNWASITNQFLTLCK